MHDRPVSRFNWAPFVRYGGAFGGLASIAYFAYQIFLTKHLNAAFKYSVIAVIVAIGIVGAIAILQRDPSDEGSGERLYTAAEVAELLNAVRSNGGRFVEAAAATPAVCLFCGEPDAEVRGLDQTRYHRRCFRAAYREREESARRSIAMRRP